MQEIACKVSYQCGTKGVFSRAHNVRNYDRSLWNKDGHIDYDKTKFNITLLDKPPDLGWFKANGFEEKIAEYNAAPSQKKNKSRRIDSLESYIKEHRNDSREIIVQLGDEDEWKALCSQVGEERAREIHKEFLTKAFQHLQEENPAFHFWGAYIHFDEATPHLQADYLPLADGASVKQAFSVDGALKAMGFVRQKKQNECAHWAAWQDDRRCKIEDFARDFTSELADEVKFRIVPHDPWDKSKHRLTTAQYHAQQADKKAREAEEKAKIADTIRKETLKETEDFVLSLEPTPTKTVKGVFGKTTKEIPKTEDELKRDRELLATQAIIRENQAERERNARNSERNAKERAENQADQKAMETYLAEREIELKQQAAAEFEKERKSLKDKFEPLVQKFKAMQNALFAIIVQREINELAKIPVPSAVEILARESQQKIYAQQTNEQQQTNKQQQAKKKGANEWQR